MKVAFVTNIVPHYRDTFYPRLAEVLRKRSDCDLLVLHGNTEEGSPRHAFEQANLAPAAVDVVENRTYRLGPYTLRWQRGALKAVKIHDPDVLVLLGIPGVLSTWLLLLWGRLHRRRCVLWVCGWEAQRGGSVALKMKRVIVRLFYRLAHHVIAYSTKARNDAMRLGVPPSQITVAYNGLDTERQELTQETHRARAQELRRETGVEGRTLFLYVGAMLAEKKVDLLIDAFAQLDPGEAALWIVGDGPALEALKVQVAEGRVEGVRFWGRIEEGVDAYFAAADLFVLPGIGGLALNQAMFHGVPCICSEADGTEDDLVVDGESGWRFEPDSSDALAECMQRTSRRHARGEIDQQRGRARQLVLEQNNVRRMVDTFTDAILGTPANQLHSGREQ